MSEDKKETDIQSTPPAQFVKVVEKIIAELEPLNKDDQERVLRCVRILLCIWD